MEKRASTRHKLTTSIVCNFLSSGRSGGAFEGEMKNCCKYGLYAELQTPIKTGTTLVIRASGGSFGYSREQGFRWLALAQVKWSKAKSVDGDIRYGTGLKYVTI
jgi:hypothetical protein